MTTSDYTQQLCITARDYRRCTRPYDGDCVIQIYTNILK